MTGKKLKPRDRTPAVKGGWGGSILSTVKRTGAVLVIIWGLLGLIYLPVLLYRDFTDLVPHTWNLVMQDPVRYGLWMLMMFLSVLGIGAVAAFLMHRVIKTKRKSV